MVLFLWTAGALVDACIHEFANYQSCALSLNHIWKFSGRPSGRRLFAVSLKTSNDPLTMYNLKEVADVVFDRVDKDHNGYLTKSELETAPKHPKGFTFRERGALNALYLLNDRLQHNSNDEFGSDNDGITRNDLSAFDRTAQQYKEGI